MYRDVLRCNERRQVYEVDGHQQQLHTSNSLDLSKGATVTGKVTRGGGRTNKEMLVTPLLDPVAPLVMRTDLHRRQRTVHVKGLGFRHLPDQGQLRLVARHHPFVHRGKHTIRP